MVGVYGCFLRFACHQYFFNKKNPTNEIYGTKYLNLLFHIYRMQKKVKLDVIDDKSHTTLELTPAILVAHLFCYFIVIVRNVENMLQSIAIKTIVNSILIIETLKHFLFE